MKNLLKSISVFALILLSFNLQAQEKGYYRFPALHSNDLVFTSEGDLWKHDLSSGQTLRLTTNQGVESHATISKDGKWIAFLGQYEGITEIYLLGISGGIPQRLTFDESRARLHGWTDDGNILYSTTAHSTLPDAQLFKLNPNTLVATQFPLAQADQGVITPNGDLYFTKLRKQSSHNKRYKGGTIQHIYKFDGQNEAVNLTAGFDGTSKNPMYFQDRIYFLSDRDGSMNIWSMDLAGANLKQHTSTLEWDYYQPDMDNGRIAYQVGADIQIYDIAADKTSTPDIKIISDFDQKRTRWIKNPSNSITDFGLSYDGEQAVITARGRVFTVPTSGDRWVEQTRKSGIRYKDASFVGKDNQLQMISDESGEFELWSMQDGIAKQITKGSNNLIEIYSTSPDGKSTLYTEKDGKLYIYKTSTRSSQLIRTGPSRYGTSFNWSSDSKWVAFREEAENSNSRVMLMDMSNMQVYPVTNDNFDSYSPRFSIDNEWLYFVSDRTFKNQVGGPWGARQPEPYYDKTSKIYALALDKNAKFPFLEENELNTEEDEEPKDKEESKGKKKKKSKSEETAKVITVNLGGLPSRLYEVPMKGANIGSVYLTEKYLFWTTYDRINWSSNLKAKKISGAKENKTKDIASKISGTTISGDGKKILLRKSNKLYVINTDGAKLDAEKNQLKIDKWSFQIDPVEDWKQMLKDAWRMERDYFYDKDMHGVNWEKVYAQYQPLLSRVNDRHELDDLMGQMISELATLHMFVYGGDKRKAPDQSVIGHLGAKLSKVAGQGYRIDHIYQSDPEYPNTKSPLGLTHMKIKDGDIITHINGVSVLGVNHINELLANKKGLQTLIKYQTTDGSSFEEIVRPISGRDNYNLKYTEWEVTRAQRVEDKSDDKIGYVHLRAMGSGNYTEWMKGYYPNFKKEGLIIDVRHNRGGNIDSWILARLLRQEWFFWASRVGDPSWNMQYAFRGHIVVLIDESTASDGEAFAEGFKALGLGKLIGMRTWGGEVWLTSSNRLVDNGIATAAEFGVYDKDGNWLIEGVGVVPDIKVENMPMETYKGKDAQLEKAIEHLQQLMKDQPITVPAAPQYPDKSVEYNR